MNLLRLGSLLVLLGSTASRAQGAEIDSAVAEPRQIPQLSHKVGLGLTWGALHYIGDYPSSTSIYARGTVRYNVAEWLAFRAVGGGGLAWSNKATGNMEVFDGAVSAILQPDLHGRWRPYVASGAGLASVLIAHDITRVDPATHDLREGMRIGYVPIEIGLEYLVTDHVSLSAMAESYAWASEPDLWDGVEKRPGDMGSFDLGRRDEIQRFGVGVTFYVDPSPDSDHDGVPNRVDRCPNSLPTESVDATGCAIDTDADGVPDRLDGCPATPRGVPADSRGCPLDADGDRIIDIRDRCPNTPPLAPTDSAGCPLDTDGDKIPDHLDSCPNTFAGASVGPNGCPTDSDKDGVPDGLDQCPNTVAGQLVDLSGCSRDADGDGVPDGLDRCGQTPKGTEIDSIGCQRIFLESGRKLTLQGVWFQIGKADLVDSSRAALARAAEAILKAPAVAIEIAGFTDEKGSASWNLKLSQARAETVRTFLIALGIPSNQLVAKGYGATQPLAPNTTESGRALNRRIEFRVK